MHTVKQLLENKVLQFVLLSFIVWRIGIQLFLLIGQQVIINRDNFIGGGLENYLMNPGLWSWANFDGEHFISIAGNGYRDLRQAFFPVFPWLMNFINLANVKTPFSYLLSGLFVSNLAIIPALYLFYRLIKIDFDDKVAKWGVIFLLSFPVSFFFGGVYSESIFFLLTIASFYFARQGRWLLAGTLGAIASATRLMGIFLLPALLWEWFEQHKDLKQAIRSPKAIITLIPVLLTCTGLLLYMRYLATNYNDPLMFVHVQPGFGADRVVDRLILLYQVFWRYFKMIIETKGDPLFFTVWLELLSAIAFLILIFIAAKRGVRYSYLIFAVLSFLIPTLTGTFSSMPRYVLVLFPCFIALSLIKNLRVKYLCLSISIALLAISTIFFTRGYFIG